MNTATVASPKNQHKNLSFFLYAFMGFLIVTSVSFYVGTTDFNTYCAQAQSGDWEGALYNGPQHSGFGNCAFNTPALSSPFLFIGSYINLFLINIYLVSKEKLKFTQYALRLFSVLALYLILVFILTSMLPTVHHTFGGGVWVGKEPLSVFPIPLNLQGGMETLTTIYGTVLFVFAVLGGPAIIWVLQEISPKVKFIHSISRSFFLVFLISIPLQLLVIFSFAMLNSFIFSSLYPRRIEKIPTTPYAPVQMNFEEALQTPGV